MNANSRSIVSLSLFLSVNIVYLLLYVLDYNILQIICYVSIMLLFFSGILVFLQVPTIPKLGANEKLEIISKEKIESRVNCIYEFVNDKLTNVRRYLLWEHHVKNITVIVALYFIGNFFSLLNFSVAFYIFTWVAFLYYYINDAYISRAYEMIKPVCNDLKEQVKLLYKSIPKLADLKKNI